MKNSRKSPVKLSTKIAVAIGVPLIFLALYFAAIYFYWKNDVPRVVFNSVHTLAGTNREFGEPFGIAAKGSEIYLSDGDQGKIWKLSENGLVTLFAQGLDTPSGIAFDGSGDLIVADSGSHTIKKIDTNGEVTTLAGTENKAGLADGDAANALFNAPIGVAVTEDNKIYVADTYNDRIRLIEKGRVTTVAGGEKGFADGAAAKFDTPCGLTVWKNGSLLVADSANRRIRVIEKDGRTWTLAGNGTADLKGGLLSAAILVQPTAISVDKSGAIYFTDGNAIRVIGKRILPAVETISNDRAGFVDGATRSARFNRPSGLALDRSGNLLVADSDNQVVRVFSNGNLGKEITREEKDKLRYTAEEFRGLQPARWPYDPPTAAREIAGTLGELRGEIPDKNEPIHFHNGLDVVGAYGETARFIRDEKVLRPISAENFATSRELLRMPTVGYIHIRLGRDQSGRPFGDTRFQFERDAGGKLSGVRIPRGTKFGAGEPIGTLNSMNHVHLIAGRSGAEMNALDALILPGASDSRAPVIQNVSVFDENWRKIETPATSSRIRLAGKTRIVVRAFDQMDGNDARRKLGIYAAGYHVLKDNKPLAETNWTIKFDRMPDPKAARFVYAEGSRSGATGETIFNYIVSNFVEGDEYREDFFDAGKLEQGTYILRVFVSDYFGNITARDIDFEV